MLCETLLIYVYILVGELGMAEHDSFVRIY